MSNPTAPLDLPSDPIDAFLGWLKNAETAGINEPTAMTLATATPQGRPSARVVLFKGIGTGKAGMRGIKFFTNYESRKSDELMKNPFASVCFFWPETGGFRQRQVRMEGEVTKVAPGESEIYFQSRPRGSRIGAWASPQSRKISSREELLKLVADVETRFKEAPVPCPPYWGGWCLWPTRIEFWQAGDFRLHDRFVFERTTLGEWTITRLAP